MHPAVARQRRIQYPGAIYHVLARGNRKGPIVHGDGDRRALLRTLGEMCERTGILVHAYAVLNNHYHFVLESPEANLVQGMGWLQNTYTRRFNVCHGLWGRLFGERYKALLVDGTPQYFRTVVDYVHLNPVRAGEVRREDGLATYAWCSLMEYMRPPNRRHPWLCVERGLGAHGLTDTPHGRRHYLAYLDQRVHEEGELKAGLANPDTDPELSLQTTIRRGWYFGPQAFKDRLLAMLEEDGEARRREADGYHGDQRRDYSLFFAQAVIRAGCLRYGVSLSELRARKANDRHKVMLAAVVASATSVPLDWLRNELGMGSRSHCSRLINDQRRRWRNEPASEQERQELMRIARSND